MSTPSQSLVVAMFTPLQPPPQPGQAIVVTTALPNLATDFANVESGAYLPPATQTGQILVSGTPPSYGWTAEAPQLVAVTTFNGQNGDVVLSSTDVRTALGYTPYDSVNPQGYQTASQVQSAITAGSAQPSSALPLMDGAAQAGTLTLYARGDHVHPSDTSKYDISNPAGYLNQSQVIALQPAVPTGSNGLPVMDGAATAGVSMQWSRSDHVHPRDSSKYDASNPAGYVTASQAAAQNPQPSVLNPLMDGTASYGVSLAYSREDHVHPTDNSRYAAANAAGYQTASQVAAAIAAAGTGQGAPPSNALPIMDGVAAPGAAAQYARGDHTHPSDTSRAPVDAPVFTTSVTLPGPPTAALQAATKAYVDAITLDCGTY